MNGTLILLLSILRQPRVLKFTKRMALRKIRWVKEQNQDNDEMLEDSMY